MGDHRERALLAAVAHKTVVQNPLFQKTQHFPSALCVVHFAFTLFATLAWLALLGSVYVYACDALFEELNRVEDARRVAEWCSHSRGATDEFVSCPDATRVASGKAFGLIAANVARRVFARLLNDSVLTVERSAVYIVTRGVAALVVALGGVFALWPARRRWPQPRDLEANHPKRE